MVNTRCDIGNMQRFKPSGSTEALYDTTCNICRFTCDLAVTSGELSGLVPPGGKAKEAGLLCVFASFCLSVLVQRRQTYDMSHLNVIMYP